MLVLFRTLQAVAEYQRRCDTLRHFANLQTFYLTTLVSDCNPIVVIFYFCLDTQTIKLQVIELVSRGNEILNTDRPQISRSQTAKVKVSLVKRERRYTTSTVCINP